MTLVSFISDVELEEIHQIFEEEGITASLAPGFGVGGGIPPEPMVVYWILSASAGWVVSQGLTFAARKFGRAVKQSILRRKEQAGPNGLINVHFQPTNVHIELPASAPDEALDDIPILLGHCEGTHFRYDSTTGRWVSLERQLMESNSRLAPQTPTRPRSPAPLLLMLVGLAAGWVFRSRWKQP